MIKQKKVLVLVVLVLLLPVVAYAAEGQPFKALQQQIDELKQQLQNIQLIPGPQGPVGRPVRRVRKDLLVQRGHKVRRVSKDLPGQREHKVRKGSKDLPGQREELNPLAQDLSWAALKLEPSMAKVSIPVLGMNLKSTVSHLVSTQHRVLLVAVAQEGQFR